MTTADVSCPACRGAGEIKVNPSPVGDPQLEESAPCVLCGGEGIVGEQVARRAIDGPY